MSLGATWARLERDALVALLEAHRWVILHAARAAGMDDTTLRRHMRRHGIARPPQPEAPRRARRPRRPPGQRFERIAPRTWQPVER